MKYNKYYNSYDKRFKGCEILEEYYVKINSIM